MDFTWHDYLKLASELATMGTEAAQRSAISRAYYAVFNLAQDRAGQNGLRAMRVDSSHKQVWEFYSVSPEPTCQRLGVIGKRLLEQRKKADYDLPFGGRLADEVTRTVTEAQSFVDQLRRLDSRHPR